MTGAHRPKRTGPQRTGEPVMAVAAVLPDGEQRVETGGFCLTVYCAAPAVYEIQLFDGWWYPQCAPCTARMRSAVLKSVIAARTYQGPAR